MTVRKNVSVLIAGLLVSSVLGLAEPFPRLWPGLEPGPYAVGYTIRHEYDPGRSFKLLGNVGDAAPSPRPVQISLWYPAAPPADAVPVTIRDYLVTAATETDFAPPDATRELEQVAKVKALVVAEGVRPKRFDRAIERATLAFRDAPPHPGSYPLALFAPGRGGNSFQSHVVCEYLASHGYVVAASPSVGRDSREMTSDPEGLETQLRDLEFLISRVRERPHVDPERIGAIGYSWGGLSVSLLAMGHDQVDAVAVLEGSVAVKPHYQLAREQPSFDTARLRQPLMMLLANRRDWPARTLAFYHDVHRADAYLLLFNELEHGDFGSLIIELVARNRKGGDRDRGRIEVGFATQCRYLRAFFDAYLKGDDEALAYLRRAPEANQVPDGVVSMQWKPALHAPQH